MPRSAQPQLGERLKIEVATEGKAPEVINIMAALKESMRARGRAKVRDAVRRKMSKPSEEEKPRPESFTTTTKPTPDGALTTCKSLFLGFGRLGFRLGQCFLAAAHIGIVIPFHACLLTVRAC
jgi:hypothetical protein